MTTRFPALLLAVAASGALFSTPVLSQEIVVTSQTVLQREAAKVSRQLDTRLADQWFPTAAEGFAIVRFTAGADGSAQDVQLYRSSGRDGLDESAMEAVAKLDRLDGLRDGVAPGTTIQANVVVARSQAAHDRLMRKLESFETQRLAGAPQERVIALTAVGARSR